MYALQYSLKVSFSYGKVKMSNLLHTEILCMEMTSALQFFADSKEITQHIYYDKLIVIYTKMTDMLGASLSLQ